jgi:hypothetical protein
MKSKKKPSSGWWTAPKMWKGSTCFIIGGGPSVKGQFPLLPYLHNERVIGVNAAFKLGDWLDVIFFGDMKFFGWYSEELVDYPGLVVSNCPNFGNFEDSSIRIMKRQVLGWDMRPDFLCWNGNSGAAAINLACLFGVKRIILLGFDMKMDNKKHNWHNYHKKIDKPEVHAKHLQRFPRVVNGVKKSGIEMINTSLISEIEGIPKMPLEEAIQKYGRKKDE